MAPTEALSEVSDWRAVATGAILDKVDSDGLGWVKDNGVLLIVIEIGKLVKARSHDIE